MIYGIRAQVYRLLDLTMGMRSGTRTVQDDDVLAEVLQMCPEVANEKVHVDPSHSQLCVFLWSIMLPIVSFTRNGPPSHRSQDSLELLLQGVQDVLEALQQDRAAAQVTRGSPAAHSFPARTRMWARMRSLLLLVLIAWSLPISLAIVAGGIVYDWARLLAAGDGEELRRRVRVALGGAPKTWRGTAIVSGRHSQSSKQKSST